MEGCGLETILLVEDDANIRTILKTFLEKRGYTVLAAHDGRKALSLLDGYPQAIHLLVTDVVMPGLGGRDIAKESRRRRPTTQILYISGFTDEVVPDSAVAFLQKPFRLEELEAKIRTILDSGGGHN